MNMQNVVDKKKIENILTNIIWDYDVKPYDLYLVLAGKRESAGPFTAEKIFIRILERLSWYDLLDIVGLDFLKRNLTGERIERKIGYVILRTEGYETIDEVVFGDKGDLILLGVRTLEGFSVMVDNIAHRFVAQTTLAC
ncbi:hypothetical protein ISS22_14140 [candidate division KSB1 bacterium]|nr:hypothetical protein [candidate division KSB1 bacterium]